MAKNSNVMAPRFYATSWAFPYLKDYPRTAENTFAELLCGNSVDLALIDELIKKCKAEFEDSELSDSVKNWNCSIHDLFLDTQVWFVTSQEIGSEVSVYNRFNDKDEVIRVPSVPSNKEIRFEGEERYKYIIINPDLLGVYLPATGTIFIFIDRIDEFEYRQFIFQMVLLHEFIHAVLDLVPDSKRNSGISKGKWTTSLNGKHIDEESVDNAIVLSAYNHDSKAKAFIASQPEEYRDALEINSIVKLKALIGELISHKLNRQSSIDSRDDASSSSDETSFSPTTIKISVNPKPVPPGKNKKYTVTHDDRTRHNLPRSHVFKEFVKYLADKGYSFKKIEKILYDAGFGTSNFNTGKTRTTITVDGQDYDLNMNKWYASDMNNLLDYLDKNPNLEFRITEE